MKDLYVLGAGDLAKELIDSIQAGLLVSTDCEFKLKACVDIKASDSIRNIPCLLETDVRNVIGEDKCFIIATAHPEIKQKLIKQFGNGAFPNFIHRNSLIVQSSLVPFSGNIFSAYSYISSDVELGSFNLFNWHVSIGHDCKLGRGNTFNPGARLSGKVQVGDFNFLGANSVVLESKSLGDRNTVGASAMLNSDISSNETWVGVPARKIK